MGIDNPSIFSGRPPSPEKPPVPVANIIDRLKSDRSAREDFTHENFIDSMERATTAERGSLLGLYEVQAYGRVADYVAKNRAFFSDITDEFIVPDDHNTAYEDTKNTTAVATLAMLRLTAYLAPNQMYPSQNEPNRDELKAKLAEFEAFNTYAAAARLNQFALDYRDWSAELAAELAGDGPTL